jgi:hypothetical protein
MATKNKRAKRRQSTVVPPITVSFEEAVSRLMKVKKPTRTPKRGRRK